MSGAEPRLPARGPGAPPRANGELVFQEPWESRAFGMAVSLCEQGLFEWEEFRTRLIAEIGAWDRAHPDGGDYRYYDHWLAALEKLLTEKRLCTRVELDGRAESFAARPHGHDHRERGR